MAGELMVQNLARKSSENMGKAVKANKIRQFLNNPRLAEFGIGSVPGAIAGTGAGHLKDKSDSEKSMDNKSRIKGKVIGGVLGAILGGGAAIRANRNAGKGLQEISKSNADRVNQAEEDLREGHSSIYDYIKSNPSTKQGDEVLYDRVYDKKQRFRDAVNAEKMSLRNLKFIKKYKSDPDPESNFGNLFTRISKKDAEDMIAKRMANEKLEKNYYDKYLKNGVKKVDPEQFKDGVFSNIKNLSKKIKDQPNIENRFKKEYGDRFSDLQMHGMSASLSSMGGGMFQKGPPGKESSRLHNVFKGMEINPDDIKKSPEYQGYVSNILKNTSKDFKSKNKGDFFERQFREKVKNEARHIAPEEVSSIGKAFNVNFNDIKTKSDFKKAYKNLAKQYHPDVNPGADQSKFQELGSAIKKLENSSWYENLAMLAVKNFMEKQAAHN